MFIQSSRSIHRTSTYLLRIFCIVASFYAAAGSLSAQVQIIDHVVPTPDSFPDSLVLGPDGAVWFTEYGANKIARTTNGLNFTEFTVPTPNCSPYGITVGPDGALWFTEYFANRIGRLTTQGAFTEYVLPSADSFPAQITTGPDGALWFTEFSSNKIGRITLQGVVSEFSLAADSNPIGIALGPDGALWFTESTGNKIGRITPAGSLTEYVVPSEFSLPESITAGPDGALWFTEEGGSKIGRISLAGAITEYPAPNGPSGITTGPDGALWFTEFTGVKVGRLTTAGTLTEYPVANPGFLRGITVGPRGALWFAQNSTNRVGQVVFQNASLSASPAEGVSGTSVTVSGSGFTSGETVSVTDGRGLFRVVTADSAGTFTFAGKLRQSPFGTNNFVASGQTSQRLGVAKYTITPSLYVTPNVTTHGSLVTVTGFGLLVQDSVELYVDNFYFAGATTTDVHGSIVGPNAVTFPISSRLPAGAHTVVALGTNGVGATANFTIQ